MPHSETEPEPVHSDPAPHLLSGAHGRLLQGLGGLKLALPSVEGAEVLQGRCHCGAAEKHISGFCIETDAIRGFSILKCKCWSRCKAPKSWDVLKLVETSRNEKIIKRLLKHGTTFCSVLERFCFCCHKSPLDFWNQHFNTSLLLHNKLTCPLYKLCTSLRTPQTASRPSASPGRHTLSIISAKTLRKHI